MWTFRWPDEFKWIWVATALLFAVSAVVAPGTLRMSSLLLIISLGRESRSDVADRLALELPDIPVLRAGDCVHPRRMANATADGTFAAETVATA